MLVTIHSSRLIGGSITAPPSKSMAHRAVLCAALATGSSHIMNLEFSKDISATLAAAATAATRKPFAATAMALALCVRIYKEYGTLDAREIRRLHG